MSESVSEPIFTKPNPVLQASNRKINFSFYFKTIDHRATLNYHFNKKLSLKNYHDHYEKDDLR